MRDGKKSPLHVGDATIAIAAGCHGCVAAQLPSIMYMYIVFAGSILTNKKGLPVTTAPLAVEVLLIAS
jgi:hypothetical protein